MRRLLAGALLLGLASAASAGPLVRLASTTVNGGNNFDEAVGVAHTAAYTYVVGVSSQGAGGTDIWVAQYDNFLNLIATRTLNGSANSADEGQGILYDPGSGDVFVVGVSSINTGFPPVPSLWVGKFSGANLTLISSATFAGLPVPVPQNQRAGLIMTGGALLTANATIVSGHQELLLAKIDPNTLALVSTTTYNHAASNLTFGQDLAVDGLGNIYVAGGAAPSLGQSSDFWLAKFTSALVLSTETIIGGAAGQSDAALAVAVDGSGVYVGGYKTNAGVTNDAFLAKFDTSLNGLASRTITSPVAGDAQIKQLVLTSTRVYAVGQINTASSADIYLAELDKGLTVVSSDTFDGNLGSKPDIGSALALDNATGEAFVAGRVGIALGNWSMLGKWRLSTPPVSAITVPAASPLASLPTLSGTASAQTLFVSSPSIASIVLIIEDMSISKYWDGTSFVSVVPTNVAASFVGGSSGTWTYSAGIGSALVSGHTYQVRSQAIDSTGLAEPLGAPRTFVYDTDVPVAAVTSPAGGAFLNGFPTISGTAADPTSSVSTVLVQISSGPSFGTCWNTAGSNWSLCPALVAASGTAAWSVSASSLPPPGQLVAGNTYRIQVKAMDQVGNIGTFGAPVDVQYASFLNVGSFSAAPFSSRIKAPGLSHDAGFVLAVDTVSGGGPYYYETFISSTQPGFSAPLVEGLAKMDSNGVVINTILLPGDRGDAGVVADGSGNVYVCDKKGVGGSQQVWLMKLDSSLNVLINKPIDTSAIGNISDMAIGGGFLYTADDGGSVEGHPKIVRYSLNTLAEVSTATFTGGTAAISRAHSIAVSGANVYATVDDVAQTERHIIGYDASLAGLFASPDVTTLFDGAPGLAVSPDGSRVYASAYDATGHAVYVKAFDSSLNFTGFVSTTTGALDPFGARIATVRTAPDGNVFLGYTNAYDGAAYPGNGDYTVIKLDKNLNFLNSQAFNGVSGSTDSLFGMYVFDSTHAVVTGASWNGTDYDAATFKAALSGQVGGQMSASALDLAPSTVGVSGVDVPMLRLALTGAGGPVQLDALQPTLLGNAPGGNVRATLWSDANGDGVLQTGLDVRVSSAVFAAGVPPRAFLPLGVSINSTTQYYFLTVSFSSMAAGNQLGLSFPNPGFFGLSSGFVGASTTFPLQSSIVSVQQGLPANPLAGNYAVPTPNPGPTGGYDTGLFVQTGQSVMVVASGTWNAGALGIVTSTGLPVTGGLDPALHLGALVGRIGGGPWFAVGSSATFSAGQPGDLFLTMNDTYYFDNSGQLAVSAQVLVSTVAKIWTGASGINLNASVNANWKNSLPPLPGDQVVFDGNQSNASCNWDIYGANPALLRSTGGYTGTITIAPAAGQLTIAHDLELFSGTLALSPGAIVTVQQALKVRGGVFDMGPGGGLLQAGQFGIIVDQGGVFRDVGATASTIQAQAAGAVYPFQVLNGTLRLANAVLTQIKDTSGLLISSQAAVSQFSNVAFSNTLPALTPSVRFGSASIPGSYTLNNVSFDVTVSTNVDASQLPAGSTVTLNNSSGARFGSPYDNDPARLIQWLPDGGTAGQINGTLLYGGSRPGLYTIAYAKVPNTADGHAFFAALPGAQIFTAQTSTSAGAFSLSLPAPNTYYVLAWKTQNASGQPSSFDPVGGYSHPGLAQASPVYIPSGGSVSSVDITINDQGAVSGTVNNASNQFGPIVVEAWGNAGPHVGDPVARVVLPSLGTGGVEPYSLSVPADDGTSLPSGQLYIQGFVDVNGDGSQETGVEAQDTYNSPTVVALATTSAVNLDLAGGGNAPGGALTVGTANPFTLHSGAIGYQTGALTQPMMRLDLSAAGSSVTLAGLQLDLSAPAALTGVSLKLYRDDNNDGIFQNPDLDAPPFDGWIGQAFVPPGLSSGVIVLTTPETLLPGSPRSYFVAADLLGTPMPPFSVSIASTSYFVLTQGSAAAQGIYPIATAPAASKFVVRANVGATSGGSGGVDTGIQLADGLSVIVSSITGSWRPDPSTLVGPLGSTGTTGLATLAPDANYGQLIGRIGDAAGSVTSDWFPIEDSTPILSGLNGRLFLAINDYDGAYFDNSGALLARFSVSGSTSVAIQGTITYPGGAPGTLHVTANATDPNCPNCPHRPLFMKAFQDIPISASPGSTAYEFDDLPAGLPYVIAATNTADASQFGDSGDALFVEAGDTATGVDFSLSQGSGTIAGSLVYSGVQTFGTYTVVVATVTEFGDDTFFYGIQNITSTSSPVAYSITGLPTPSTYYVVAFRDVNGDTRPDGAEPFGIIGASSGPLSQLSSLLSPVYLGPSATVNPPNLTLLDRGALQGGVTLSTAAANADLVVQVGHGRPGDPGYLAEDEQVYTLPSDAAAGDTFLYSSELLRPGTDYTVFAFVSPDASDFFEPGDTFGSAGPLAVAGGAFGQADLVLQGNTPPGPVPSFVGVGSSASSVLWTWSRVTGATSYQLQSSTGGVLATVPDPLSSYTDVVGTNTASSIARIRALNAFGAGPILASPQAVYSFAAVPPQPSVTTYVSSATISWPANGNPAATVYRVSRATAAAGPFTVVFTSAATSGVDPGLLPATQYYWKADAVNGNGVASAASAIQTATTNASAGSALTGTLTYTGREPSLLVVQASTAPGMSPVAASIVLPHAASQSYFLGVPGSGSYYVRAFVDLKGNGVADAGADASAVSGPTAVGASPVGGVNLSVGVDTVAPSFPVGLSAATPFGVDQLSWSAPASSADGGPIRDLAGFRVYRATLPAGPFAAISTGTVFASTAAIPYPPTTFSDLSPVPGVVNYYRVTALDYEGNESGASAAVGATPFLGGTIAGSVSDFGSSSNGPLRVRLSTTPFGGSFISETALNPFSFTGLSDGVYYVSGFRDANGDGKQQNSEAAGTLGGLVQPYPVQIFNGSSVTGLTVNVCDRTAATFGQGVPQDYPLTLSSSGCPALDQGPGFFTNLLSFTAGGGAAGSVGLGARLFIQMRSTFPNRLLLLGPDGSVAAQDSRPGGASLNFTPTVPGRYVLEPTSFNAGDAGASTVSLSVAGGYSGAISGTLSYAGSQSGGPFVVQLFTSQDQSAFPIFQSTFAAAAYSIGGLPDGAYYLRAYRDVNGNFTSDAGEPSGVFGVSASSLTPVQIQGGVAQIGGTLNASANLTLTDPAVGSISGQIFRQGTQAGTIRVVVGVPSCAGCGDVKPVAVATVAAAGPYTVPFIPPATSYIVQGWVDVNGDSHLDTLEAQGSTQPIRVVANQATSVNLLIADPGSGATGNATVQGELFYTGVATGPLMIGFATDSQFQNVSYVLTQASTGPYLKTGLVGGTSYYLAVFRDSNLNGEPDSSAGEPMGFYGASPVNDFNSMQPLYVPSAGTVSADLTLGDAPSGQIGGQVTYSGSAPLSQNLIVQASKQNGRGGFDSQKAVIARQAGVTTYGYSLPFLNAATNYYVSAWIDANGNGGSDFGEPFAQYGQTSCVNGPCFGTAVAVSSGAGTFPAYGINVTVQDPGSQGGALQNSGQIQIDSSYLGSQKGPVIVRVFTDAAMAGTPFMTLTIPLPPGPGDVRGTLANVPFGTYYLDAFRDPAGTGAYNPAFDAYGQFNSVTVSASNSFTSAHDDQGIVDPGQGGSVNVYSGGFASAGGARFDGGAVDFGAGVAVDSWTAGGPYVYVEGLTKQNQGIVTSLVKYSSAGVFVASMTVSAGEQEVTSFAIDPAGNVIMGGEIPSVGGGPSTGTVVKLSPSLALLQKVQLSSDVFTTDLAIANGLVYAALDGANAGSDVARRYDPATMTQTGAATYRFPASAVPNCFGPDCTRATARALTVDAAGDLYVLATSNFGGAAKVYELLKFGPALGSPLAQADVTQMVPNQGDHPNVNLGADAAGEVFLSVTPLGDTNAHTYKFSPSLLLLAQTSFGPVVSHFGGGLRNLVVASTDNYVYEAWEVPGNGGDMVALRYDTNLNLLSQRTFDGLDNSHEDFAFGLDVLNSGNVFLTGGATNANGNLDWATERLDLTTSGAQSGAGAVVVISTSNAVSAVFGAVRYAGALQSSGTVRAVLLPLGQSTPIRFSSAAFAASTSYLFNNVPAGVYQVQAFIDGNTNFSPDPGEAIAFSSSTGFQFQGAASQRLDLTLCDRRPIDFGQTIQATITPADCPSSDRGGAYQRLYTFTGARGQAVTITNAAVNFVDTALYLYDPSGRLAAVGDDSSADSNARITSFLLPADGLYTIAASPFSAALSSATIKLTLGGSAGSLGSIGGTVAYTGAQGGQILMGLFSTSTFLSGAGAAPVQTLTVPGPGPFSFAGLASGSTYYLGGFVDVNANGHPDAGEDIGFFGSTTTGPAPILLRSGQNVSGVNFTIASQSTAALADVSGLVSYSGTRVGTLHVEFWSGSSFQGQPAATRLLATGVGPYDVLLKGGLPYYVRAWLDANGDFLLGADEPMGVYAPHGQGAEAVFAPSTGTLSGVTFAIADPGALAGGAVGEGSAAIAPSTAAAGAPVLVATITYTAGLSGLGVGGKLGFSMPPGFAPPLPGSVTVASTATATFSPVSFSNLSAFVSLTAGSVTSGQQVLLVYTGGPVSCAASTQTFTVTESQNGAVSPQPLLAGSPALAVSQGAPTAFTPSNPYLSLTRGALSDAQTLIARDACGNQAPVTAAQGPQTVTLRAKRFDVPTSQFVADATVGLSSGAFLSTAAVEDFPIAVGKSSATFYAVSASTGFKNIEVFYTLGAPTTFYYGLTALPNNALTNVSIATVSFGVGASSATITPSGGSASLAFVNFTLGDPNQSWHVLVSSRPFRAGTVPTPLWETWGYGQPNPGQVAWDGRFSPWINGGARVPTGLYYVRVEVAGGGVHDDSLLANVIVPQVSGRFLDAGLTPNPPLASANAQVYGPNGTLSAQSDASGAYVLPGMAPGTYNMFVSRQDFLDGNLSVTIGGAGTVSTFTAVTPTVTASTNAAGGIDIAMNRAAVLLVVPSAAVGTSTQAADQWGSLQVNTSTSIAAVLQRSYFQPLRLAAGTTTFDDGGQWDSSSQQFIVHTLFKFTVAPGTYTVAAKLPGFAPSTAAVYVAQGLNTLTLPALSRKSSISGTITVPANPAGLFVSVNAVPLSTTAAAAGGGGGVQLPAGALSGVYTVGSLDAGSYLLRANTNGLAFVSTGPIAVPASSDVTHVDFPGFSAGASIAGTITLNADTTGDSLSLQVSAWSPGSLNFGSTNVFHAGGASGLAVPYQIQGLSAGATYQLYVNVGGHNGTRLDQLGPQPVLVAAPSASANVTFSVSSGVISGTIILPPGSTDFYNVSLNGQTIASGDHPDDVGHTFTIADATQLPGFACYPAGAVVGGSCSPATSTATFTVQNQGTETDDITLYYATTGQAKRLRLSTVNGSTTTVFVDLSPQTFAISGSINNQVTNALYNTNPKILANAPFLAPQGYPAGISSTTARVVAIKQDLAQYNVAISTVFDPVSSRVGFLTAAGTWTITNVPSGVYFVRTADLRACTTCDVLVPKVGQLVNVAGVSASSVSITLSDGFSVSGSISLDGGLQDSQVFGLSVLNQRQEVVRSTTVYLGDAALGVTANAVSYAFTNLPAGDFYTLVVTGSGSPVKYVGRPIKFPNPGLSPNGLQSNLSAQNVVLQRAAYITGRLQDSNTGVLITAANASLLAPSFQISATASPWVEGGFAVAASSSSGRPVQADGSFLVGPLLPGISYSLKLGQLTWDPTFLANGSQNYTPVTLAGLTPQTGQLLDVGVVALNQGQSLTGSVRASTTTGAGLGNIQVLARPSFGASDVVVQTYTDQNGKYTLWVSTYISNQFDVTAAPRGGNLASNGKVYSQVTLRNVNLLATTTADFLLNPLLVTVTGQVNVADAATGGQLSYPFGDQKGFYAAAVFLQPQGVVPQSNPLGDIQQNTDSLGAFSITGLSTGTYSLRTVSLGYAVFNATVTASTSTYVIYTGSNTPANYLTGNTITLQRGATITGRILKSDGTAPNTSEVGGVAAANFSQGEYVVGSVDVDKVAKTVNSYTISGFKPGIAYNLVILPADKRDDTIFPPEGAGVSFLPQEASSTKNINLTFTSTSMQCVATAKAAGNQQFQIKIDCNKDLRNQVASDNDLAQILSVSTYTSAGAALSAPNGTGTLDGGDKKIEAGRKEITAIYRTAASETSFSLRLRATASEVDPKTGSNFTTDQVFDFYTGLTSNVSDRVSNINGGSIQLQPSAQDELLGVDEKSRIDLQPGTFAAGSDSLPDSSVVALASTTVTVGIAKAQDRNSASLLSLRSMGYVPSSLGVLGEASAFPPELAAAMTKIGVLGTSTTTAVGVNPISSFYSIFLPLGIRHQLKQRADITFSYNTSLSSTPVDTDNVNVWWFDTVKGAYTLENTNRRIDATNKTITVAVNHFSVFVVLNGAPSIAVPTPNLVPELLAFNFPNPSDCSTHVGVQRDTRTGFGGQTFPPFNGTMLRFSTPNGDPAGTEIRIYNLAGELVRTMDEGTVNGNTTAYTPWDCTNNSGRPVASGVYIGEVHWGSHSKFFKIALIRGSGL